MKTEFKYCLFFLGLVLYAMFFTNQFTFSPGYATYSDTFNLYGLHLITDPSLFPGDSGAGLWREIVTNPGAGTFLFVYLYKGLLALTGLPQAMKLISLFCAFLSAFLIYRAGLRLAGNRETAFLLASFHTIYFLSMDSFYFGQSRTLGALINSLLIYALCSQKYLLIPFFTPLFYVTYPYLAFSSTLLAAAIPFFRRKELAGRGRAYLAALGLAAALTLLPRAGASLKLIQHQHEIFKYKLLSRAGLPLDPHNVMDIFANFMLNINEQSLLYLIFTCVFLAAIALDLFKNGSRNLRLLGTALGPACASFLAGFILLAPFSIMFSARQLSLILPSAIALAAGLAAANLRGENIRMALPWLALLFFVSMHPFFSEIEDFRSFRGLYERIGELPAGSKLGGNPYSLVYAGVPIYAKRAIFYASGINSTHVAAGGDAERAREVLLRALCSDTAARLRITARREKITHFLVEDEFYMRREACRGALFDQARSNGLPFETIKGRIYLLDAGKI